MTYAASLQITTATAWDTWYSYSDRACADTAKVYRWYVATFFSAKAQARYTWIGQMIGCGLALAILYTQRWAEDEVQSCLHPAALPLTEADREYLEALLEEVYPTDPFHLPEMVAAIPASMAPVATLVVKVESTDYAALNSAQLRKVCSQRGITWRNAHGPSKHLSKGEMVAALA
jgi:hypothetical protein